MRVVEVDVHNPSGLHARPAATLVKAAAGFRSQISIRNITRGSGPANAKSLLAVLGCGVERSHRIAISADGEDETAAIEALQELAESGFGEAAAS
ncbi:MAG TPA: HPr family phosphocarrier protein [Candidatus Limnocylindrales bacterium]|jgi:phosphotransferase system HPr (HPr) family protein|nr:HPr family phosphocarrier protein [Candidatus Limnocylindrales bacterium]